MHFPLIPQIKYADPADNVNKKSAKSACILSARSAGNHQWLNFETFTLPKNRKPLTKRVQILNLKAHFEWLDPGLHACNI